MSHKGAHDQSESSLTRQVLFVRKGVPEPRPGSKHHRPRWLLPFIPVIGGDFVSIKLIGGISILQSDEIGQQHKGEGEVQEIEVLTLISKIKQNSLFTFGRKNEQKTFLILPPKFFFFKKTIASTR